MDIGLGRLTDLTLDSRFTDLDAPVLLSGVQALVRVLLEQARLDRAAGHNTGGLVSGYRGSPLGGLDLELWRHEKLLAEQGIRFQPGLNEDLAATLLWGTQQIEAFPGAKAMACSACGTPRGRAWTVQATRCTARRCWARRRWAACWR